MTRYKAAAIHLAISACIVGCALLVVYLLWYPPPLFAAMGGRDLVLLLAGVDIAIGPLITLIVFAKGKKTLRFDLATIAFLQLAALSYGVYAMFLGRPVFVAFVERRMAVVSAADLEDEYLAMARPEYRVLSKTGPLLVAVDTPTDPKELEWVLLAGLGGGGAQHLPHHYVPYESRLERVLSVARPLESAKNITNTERTLLNQAINRSGLGSANLRYLPVTTRHSILTALIDGRSGRLIELLPVNPVR